MEDEEEWALRAQENQAQIQQLCNWVDKEITSIEQETNTIRKERLDLKYHM